MLFVSSHKAQTVRPKRPIQKLDLQDIVFAGLKLSQPTVIAVKGSDVSGYHMAEFFRAAKWTVIFDSQATNVLSIIIFWLLMGLVDGNTRGGAAEGLEQQAI